MSFDVNDWYRDLLTWMRTARGPEALEVQTDCANELYLNALIAMHLRRYGRARGFRGWWARCEWAKVDISFGAAETTFDDWDAAWNQGITGDIGQIEAKVLYSHFARSQRTERLEALTRQLKERRGKDEDEGHRHGQLYLGLIWMVSYEAPEQDSALLAALRADRTSRQAWTELFAATDLMPRDPPVERPESAAFDLVTTLEMRSLWPLNGAGTASLWVTLVESTRR